MKVFWKTIRISLSIIQASMHHHNNQVDLVTIASENDLLFKDNKISTTLSQAYTRYYEPIQKNKISQIFKSLEFIILSNKQQYVLLSNIIKQAIRQENKNYISIPAGFYSLISSAQLSEIKPHYSNTLGAH